MSKGIYPRKKCDPIIQQKRDIKRFLSHVNINDLFDCWEWTGRKKETGYGITYFKGKESKAHRVSYLLSYGTIDNNLFVLHKCNNPSCVNPAHLYLGTPQDNMNDMVKANRSCDNHGENNPNSKLTEKQVIEIIELLKTNISQVKIAQIFSVSKYIVNEIKTGNTWKHIPR
jgi:hypothetical protein